MIDRVAVLFLAGSALFGATLLSEIEPTNPGGQPVATPAPAPEQTSPAQRTPSPRINDLVATTLSRPLFSATRRPAERAVSGAPADPGLTDVRLTGTVIEPSRRTAIFAVQGAKLLARSEGETVNDWHLDAIGPREVTLTGSAGTTTLQPKNDPNLVRTGQPAQAAAAAQPGGPPVQPAAAGTQSPAPSEAQPPSPVARPSVPPPPPARLQNVGANTARPGNPVRATAPIAAVTAQNRTLGSPGEPQSPARSPNPERNGGLGLASSAAKAPDPPAAPTEPTAEIAAAPPATVADAPPTRVAAAAPPTAAPSMPINLSIPKPEANRVAAPTEMLKDASSVVSAAADAPLAVTEPPVVGTQSQFMSDSQSPSPVAKPAVAPPPPARLQKVGANTARSENPALANTAIGAANAESHTLGSPKERQGDAQSPNPERIERPSLATGSAEKLPDLTTLKPTATERIPEVTAAAPTPVAAAPLATAAPSTPVVLSTPKVETTRVVAGTERPKDTSSSVSVAADAALPVPKPPVVTSTAITPPSKPHASPAEAAVLLSRGDAQFALGDLASARLFYERAADGGNGEAALRLGETYDPNFLQRAKLLVVKGDPAAAVFWYRRARELGAAEAEILLKYMQTK
jgi:hypothetical protein